MPQAVVATESSTAEQTGSGDTKRISERAAGKRKAKKVPLGTPHETKKLRGPSTNCCKYIFLSA